MKVLHVIPSLSAVHGGPSRAMRLIAQALTACGVEVEIATTDDDGPGKRMAIVSEVVSPSEVNSLPLPASPTGGVGANPQGWGVRRYFPKRTEFYKVSPAFSRWVFRHVHDYDVVHIHALFSFTSIAAAWAARRAGVPYVVRPLGTLNEYGVKQRRPWLKRLSLRFVEEPILRHAAVVHFTAEAEKREAEALGIPMRGVVIPLGVEALSRPTSVEDGARQLLARYPQLAGKSIVLFLSRLDAKKNVEGLLKAFGLLVGEYPDLRLLIAGDGKLAYVAGLKKLAGELGLEERVIWAGHLDGEIKSAAFAAASVFALPSFSENFGIAAAEALSAGLPCVLGEGVAIAGEVQQAGAGLAVAPEPSSIAAALHTLLADVLLRVAMAQKAAVFAREKYSVEAMGMALVQLYEGIVNIESGKAASDVIL